MLQDVLFYGLKVLKHRAMILESSHDGFHLFLDHSKGHFMIQLPAEFHVLGLKPRYLCHSLVHFQR